MFLCHFIIILDVLVYNLLDGTLSHLGIKRYCVFILPYGQSSKGKWVSCGDRSQKISDSLHFIIFFKHFNKISKQRDYLSYGEEIYGDEMLT